MSVPATEGTGGPEAIELPPTGDAAFGALMDALAPEADAAPAGTPAAGAPAAPAGDGGAAVAGAPEAQRPTAGEPGPAGGGGDPAGEPAQRDQGTPAGDSQQPAATPGSGDRPADWTVDATSLAPKFGELSTALEENTSKAFQQQALEEVRTEHQQYFDALQQHPRLLVGKQVPAIGKEGMETLRDTNDAREWQEAVKHILVSEVQDRAGRQMEENADFLTTVHASIELFQNNLDLVPGTQGFDVDLANRFAAMAEPYELRVDGKLQGYSIPVQPLINSLRTQISAERAAKPETPVASPPATGAPGTQPAAAAPPADPPQAGISSKAGAGSASEDFSTLFGTIGLPNLQI